MKLLFGTKKKSVSKDEVIKNLKRRLAHKESLMEITDALIKAKDENAEMMESLIERRDATISFQRQALQAKGDQDAEMTVLKNQLASKDALIKAKDAVIKSQLQALQAKVVSPSHEQTTAGETSSTGPHEAIVLEDIVSLSLSFLGLAELAAGARTCRTWSRAAISDTCWLAIARSRWPEWATRLESEVGTSHTVKSAFKEKLRHENRLITVWKQQTIPPRGTAEYGMYHGNPDGVPLISWLYHQGHITGSAATLATLSHNVPIPAPIFKRYEASARAMYGDKRTNGGSFEDLLPVPPFISDRRRRSHERVRRIIKAIFFNPDGSLMYEMPDFGYRNEVALYFSGTYEFLSPAQVVAGIRRL